jgi:hypothetical protein
MKKDRWSKRVVVALAASGAALVLALPAGATDPPADPQFGGSGSAPGTAQVGIQSTTIGTDVSPINGFWNQGWWSANFPFNFNANTNYIAGSVLPGFVFRNYFTFDITALSAHPCRTPQSATLTIPRGQGFPATFVNYSLYDVSTDPFVLSQKVNNPDPFIFNDLGSGALYGSYFLPTAAGPDFVLPLNLTALNAIATAKANGEQFWSVGGSLVPQPVVANRWLFGFTGFAPIHLTVNWPFICRIRPPA